jgi:sulfur-oxidizing protein SoxX
MVLVAHRLPLQSNDKELTMPKNSMKKIAPWALVAATMLSSCATERAAPTASELDQLTQEIVARSFRDQGLVKVASITQDETQRVCSEADVKGVPLSEAESKAIEEANLKTIKWPSDGKFLGDWKEGEKIAQSGRGLTWSDEPSQTNGGNCYNCHQIAKAEISYGTIGPSLYNYGKIRGVSDPSSAQAKPIVEYTWGKIYNSKAYNACSNMPRAGHKGILNESQIRHVMALLLDPKSPVNQ